MQGDVEALAKVAIDCGFKLHKELGPGLLESVYELLMCEALKERGLFVEVQKVIQFRITDVCLSTVFAQMCWSSAAC